MCVYDTAIHTVLSVLIHTVFPSLIAYTSMYLYPIATYAQYSKFRTGVLFSIVMHEKPSRPFGKSPQHRSSLHQSSAIRDTFLRTKAAHLSNLPTEMACSPPRQLVDQTGPGSAASSTFESIVKPAEATGTKTRCIDCGDFECCCIPCVVM
ncbi:hypothetical protein GGR52DRAFT_369446 [Hypoxylon sp. FL1284]|nr:hypothetical protein GGR52DRAFT_369446 [Hypoxylon sp. FL1284]